VRNFREPISTGQTTERVPITSLLVGDSPRLNGEDDQHIQLLAASEQTLPPIIVHRQTMRVIDGMHRLRAAALKGESCIEISYFEGSEEDAFVTAVKANIAHGLPLSLNDRRAAAARIVATHPHKSDRSIAAITGLAPGTVGAIRRHVCSGEGGGEEGILARIGRDGRVRPLDTTERRRIAADVIAKDPDASLRMIAKIAGISPATARDVRERLRLGSNLMADGQVAGRARHSHAAKEKDLRHSGDRAPRDRASLLQALKKDPSLRFTERGRVLLRSLCARATGPDLEHDALRTLPPHSAYLVAELARRCAADWMNLADQVEQGLAACNTRGAMEVADS
jgi:hypothetical protein